MAKTDSTGKVSLFVPVPYAIYIYNKGYRGVFDTIYSDEVKFRSYKLTLLSFTLNEAVITGQYKEKISENSAIQIKVIDAKQIERQAATDLTSLLSQELNIKLQPDALLGTGISLNGISGQNVKILIDGVPVTGRLNGNLDLSQINLNQVKRVEIIEGPMSVIYGSDALGGVINIIMKKETDSTFSFGGHSYYESNGKYNFDGKLGMYKGKAGLLMDGGRNFFGGIMETDSTRTFSWKPKEQIFGNVNLSYENEKWTHNLSARGFREMLLSRGVAVITSQEAHAFDDYYFTKRLSFASNNQHIFSNNAHLELTTAYNYYNRERQTFRRDLVTIEDTRINNNEVQDTNVFHDVLLRGTYTRANDKKLNYQTGYDINYQAGYGRRLLDGKQAIADAALYTTIEYLANEKLLLRPGIRADWNSRFPIPVIPSFNLKYDMNKHFNLRTSYSRGYRAPSLKELDLDFVDVNHNIFGNKNLKPERSHSFNTDFNYRINSEKWLYRFSISGFYSNIKNLITLSSLGGSSLSYSYINVNKSVNTGVNVGLNLRTAYFTFNVSGSLICKQDLFNQSSTFTDFAFSREANANISYYLSKLKTNFNFFIKYNGKQQQYASDLSNKTYLAYVNPYTLADASLSRKFMKERINLSAGCKNLFNVKTIDSNLSTVVHSSGNGLLASTGRTFFIDLKFDLGL